MLVVTPALLLLAVLASGPAEPAAPPGDPRTTVVLHEICASQLDRRDLTLYANGTIRLREGPVGGERLVLHEIGHDELEAIRRHLEDLDLGSAESAVGAPVGDWVLQCRLEVVERDGTPHSLRFGDFDTGGLVLADLRRVVASLLESARKQALSAEIPASYVPVAGDRLERNDGNVYEVVGPTSDGKAIELRGVDQPIAIFIERSQLRIEFRRVVESGEAR